MSLKKRRMLFCAFVAGAIVPGFATSAPFQPDLDRSAAVYFKAPPHKTFSVAQPHKASFDAGATSKPVFRRVTQVVDRDEEIAFVQDRESIEAPERSLLEKVQGMQQELQELRGQLEMQAHHLKTLQQQQLSFYKDLDGRLRQSSNAGETGAPSRTVPQDAPATLSVQAPAARTSEPEKTAPVPFALRGTNLHRMQSANEQLRYLAAYDLVKSKRFDEALEAMQTFITQYPRGGYTANAEYWLGELYMVKNNYSKAIDHFETVLKKFPLSSKTAASTLKIGYALAASGKIEEAKMRLQEVLKNYPDTPTAQLAATKLDSLSVS